MRAPAATVLAAGGLGSSASASELDTDEEKLGYSVGYQVGGDFERQKIEIDPDLVVKGVMAALSGTEPEMTGEEMRAELRALRENADAAGSDDDGDDGGSDPE